jgi:sugar O-acyltransferase (sialic acid O-acetyltransferase NeuD family)
MNNLPAMIIIGSGGHAVSVANVALSAGYKIAYFVDKRKIGLSLLGINIIGNISDLDNNSEFDYSIAVGDNHLREKIYQEFLKKYGYIKFPSLVHHSAVISHFSKIKDGTVVMPGAVVGPNSTIGKFCIINTHSSIDHDCVMSDFSSLAPGAVTGGTVEIGFRSSIAIRAVINQGINVGEDCILGASSYLKDNLPDNSVAYGAPAKVIRRNIIDSSPSINPDIIS